MRLSLIFRGPLSPGHRDRTHTSPLGAAVPGGKDVLRILAGGFIFVSGLLMLGLFGWEPPVAGPEARPFQIAMHDAGYFMPVITAVFLAVGASVICNRFGALASLALLPISVNIVLFHAVLEAGQLPLAAGFFLVNCYLLWYYRGQYRALWRSKPASYP